MGSSKQEKRSLIKRLEKGILIGFMLVCSFSAVNAIAKKVTSHKSSSKDSYAMQYSVKLQGGRGQCSGEQVVSPSGEIYILSAGHCAHLAGTDGSIKVTTEDGRVLQRKIIAEDINSDLLLIEGVPGMDGLRIAYDFNRHDHVRTFTHGAGLDTYKTEGYLIQMMPVDVILGEVSDITGCSLPKERIIEIPGAPSLCSLHVIEVVSTAMIVPGSSGGMVVNDSGELIAVVSASDGKFGFFVHLGDIRAFLSNY